MKTQNAGNFCPETARKNNAFWLVATSAIALAGSLPAHAQETTDTQEVEDDFKTIVVTAQFREQRLQDTPIAITALTGDLLEERGINDVSDLSQSAPNVNITNSSPSFGASVAVYIRGIGQYDNNFAYEPGVGIYLDDVYYGVMTGADFQLADVARVEVLRGPQGTLAGKNSLGGAIKLYSQIPNGLDEGYVETSVGDYNKVAIRGAYDFTLAPDRLFMRVSGFSNHRDGYVKLIDYACANPDTAGDIPASSNVNEGCQIGSEGGEKSWGARTSLRWLASDTVDATISLDRTVDRSDPAASSLFYAYTPFGPITYDPANPDSTPYDTRFIPDDPYTSYSTYRDTATGFYLSPTTETKAWGISGDVEWSPAESLIVRSITAYRGMRSKSGYDQDGSPISLALTRIDNSYHQFTQELRLSGTSDLVDWTVGGFYYDAEGRIMNRIDSGPTQFITDDPVKTTSKSVFAHAVLNPFENFHLIGGIRYTDDKKTYDFNRLSPFGEPEGGLAALNGLPLQVFSGDRIDYRLGVDYRFSDAILGYAQFSTGYKGGGVNPKPFTAGQALPYNPETLDAWEVGFKSDLFGNALRLNGAAFLNKYKDIILVNAAGYCGEGDDPAVPPSCAFFSALPFNAGKADIKGVELEADLTPTDGLTLTGSLSYLDFQYKQLAPAAVASGITLSDVPPLTPKWKLSGGISYSFDIGNFGTLTPRIDAQYTSEVYFDPANHAFDDWAGVELYHLPGYATADARIGFESADGNWQASVSVSNLTDKVYYTSGFAFYYTGTGQRVIGAPRMWSLSIRRNF